MLPLAMATPPLAGPLTPEMRTKLHKIKFCVIGIFVAAVGRLATGDDMPFNELLCGVNGVFLLRDDPSLGTCYACLASSPLGHCAGPTGGGLSCLMPFLFVSSFNCIFLALRLFYGYAGPFVLVSFAFQSAGAVLAWRLNTLVTAAAVGEFGASGQGQPLTQPLASMHFFPQPGEGVEMAGRGGGGHGAGSSGGRGGGGHGGQGRGGRQEGFVAFTGYAQRLGDAPPAPPAAEQAASP
mmetsp:Transcript_85184/g.264931  ORF Transcript_85184/g.264931 Transcript_85184/m.264931 type:complete len:238 (-) Transcript_85184:122-835(-)